MDKERGKEKDKTGSGEKAWQSNRNEGRGGKGEEKKTWTRVEATERENTMERKEGRKELRN